MRPVSPGYFDVFRIPLLRGRTFNERDARASAGVVLISEGMAKKFWPGADPVGQRIDIDKYHVEFAAPPRQIIGVVGDVRNLGIEREPDPMMYLPQTQIADGMTAIDVKVIPITWVVRTRGEPFAMSAAVQEELRKASGGFPVSHIRSMEQVLGGTMARSDFNTMLLAVFAGTALLLSAIGIYGLMTYFVQQRTREIAIRIALGADAARVRNTVLAEGLRLTLTGVILGIAAALGLARLMTSLVYGVKTTDPGVLVVVAVLLSLVALIASYLPSRRATQVDPITALRAD